MENKPKRNWRHKQHSAGGFELNKCGLPLNFRGGNALKSTFASKKKKK